ncbi:hypothetical protein [Nostoc sp.]
MAIFSHLQMTLAMRREFQFPADKRFHVNLTPIFMNWQYFQLQPANQ